MENPTPRHPDTPTPSSILIVGAGPTGLTLAIELARRGVPFRLIERDLTPPATSRAIGTQPRTVEVFRLMGIPPSALRPAVRPCAFRFQEGARIVARVAFGEERGGPAPPVIMDEAETERVLTARLERLGGRVERGVALEAFRYDGGSVVATLAGTVASTEMHATFLAGCDGAGSLVRRQAGIPFEGSTYPELFLLADLDLDWEIPHDEATVWIGDEYGVAAALPLPAERRWRIIVAAPPGGAGLPGASETDVAMRAEAELRRRAQIPLRQLGDPIWASVFHLHRRLARRYRRGPVFLAGDAAHVHSPIGGQGMNTGIQDAFNLGWKLALAAEGRAAPGLLDSYETERQPVARAVLRATNLGQRLMFGSSAASRAFRDALLPALIQLAPVRERLLTAISELHIAYRDSPLSVDADELGGTRLLVDRADGLRAGDRVPDIALRRADGLSLTLFNLISGGWTLLLLPDRAATPGCLACLASVARETAEMAGETVQRLLVTAGPAGGEIAATALVDPDGAVARAFGAADGLVALVRPDGYLGFRGLPNEPGALAPYLARVFAIQLRDSPVAVAGATP